MPGKKTVSVKRFLTDFRSGASDADLMVRHGLDRRGLDKMLRVLEERQLIGPEDLKRALPVPPEIQGIGASAAIPHSASEIHTSDSPSAPEQAEDTQSACPQCGAQVTERMLTCPECGHVLPGETRWSRVQPEKSSRSRVPPWIVGCIIACPIALGLYAVFKHILIPMSRASIHQRTQGVSKPPQPKISPRQTVPKDKPAIPTPAVPTIEEQMERLTDDGVLLRASEDYTLFTVTDRWYALSRDEKIAFLTQLSSALLSSDITVPFRVKDDAGILAARVNPQSMELLDRYGFSETIQRSASSDGEAPSPGHHTPDSSRTEEGQPHNAVRKR